MLEPFKLILKCLKPGLHHLVKHLGEALLFTLHEAWSFRRTNLARILKELVTLIILAPAIIFLFLFSWLRFKQVKKLLEPDRILLFSLPSRDGFLVSFELLLSLGVFF